MTPEELANELWIHGVTFLKIPTESHMDHWKEYRLKIATSMLERLDISIKKDLQLRAWVQGLEEQVKEVDDDERPVDGPLNS